MAWCKSLSGERGRDADEERPPLPLGMYEELRRAPPPPPEDSDGGGVAEDDEGVPAPLKYDLIPVWTCGRGVRINECEGRVVQVKDNRVFF